MSLQIQLTTYFYARLSCLWGQTLLVCKDFSGALPIQTTRDFGPQRKSPFWRVWSYPMGNTVLPRSYPVVMGNNMHMLCWVWFEGKCTREPTYLCCFRQGPEGLCIPQCSRMPRIACARRPLTAACWACPQRVFCLLEQNKEMLTIFQEESESQNGSNNTRKKETTRIFCQGNSFSKVASAQLKHFARAWFSESTWESGYFKTSQVGQ